MKLTDEQARWALNIALNQTKKFGPTSLGHEDYAMSAVEKLIEQKAELESLQERFKTEFKNIANEILEDKSKRFTEQNKTNLDEILKPFSEKIKDFEKKVGEAYDKEMRDKISLKEEMKNLLQFPHNPEGVEAMPEQETPQPLQGCSLNCPVTQGSSFLATLGWRLESRWDSGKRALGIGAEEHDGQWL